jgi:single-stranded-DNA-specific exonuclease
MRWIYKKLDSVSQNKAKALSIELKNAPYPLCEVLIRRSIDTFEKSKVYFRPDLNQLYNPFLMKDMDKAVQRTLQAIERKEKILIYGDYDVDGTTAVSLMYSFFKPFYKEYIDIYIPDRYTEGYGVSFQGIDFAKENGFTLIISLDCGIRSADKIEYAKDKGIDFIICDHHLPGDSIPQAVAVLDAKQKDCPYPFKELSGCGVGFKLCQALSHELHIPADTVHNLLDFVAISIASDLVDVVDENRIMMYHGIKVLEKNPKNGIKALMQVSGVDDEKLDTNDLVFKIGPRINAAGRLKHAKYAVELLISEREMPQDLAKQLDQINEDRKGLDKNITDEALYMLSDEEVYGKRKSTVLFKENWHKGVIGIVASRVVEKYYKPTIMLTESDGKLVGSARSVHEFDVHEAICECGDLLIQYGGHKYAAGLALKKDNLEAFIDKFEKVVSSRIQPHSLEPVLAIDAECDFSIFNDNGKFVRILKQMSPFGPQNPNPVFASSKVFLYTQYDDGYRVVGNQHLQLSLTQDNKISYRAIAFGMGTEEIIQKIKQSNSFNIAYHVEENTYNGKTNIQLRLKDIQWV